MTSSTNTYTAHPGPCHCISHSISFSIERITGFGSFHPFACAFPGAHPRVLLSMQAGMRTHTSKCKCTSQKDCCIIFSLVMYVYYVYGEQMIRFRATFARKPDVPACERRPVWPMPVPCHFHSLPAPPWAAGSRHRNSWWTSTSSSASWASPAVARTGTPPRPAATAAATTAS